MSARKLSALPALIITVVVTTMCAMTVSASPAWAAPSLPNSMAATGDSITRAFDATSPGCVLRDCPQYSWSTGTSTTVDSQYQRLLAANAPISSRKVYNDAKTGAQMSALDGQLKSAARQKVQYVTVLMGANDLCTSSPSTMTNTTTFQSEAQTALTDFFRADRNAHVALSSIPDLYQLWSLLSANPAAESTWSAFSICQSMLATSNTEADRQQVVTQEAADNSALAAACSAFQNCRWDNLAVYNYRFTTADVSTVDYFHPSLTGQNSLATTTWSASYWPSAA